MTAGFDWLREVPRVELGHLPTPLEPMDRLTDILRRESGGGPRLWVKRDDCTGLASGGNKTRKLEYLLAEAVARGARCVVTFGAVQSNHARQTAAGCARLGLGCDLVLSRRVPWPDPGYERSGNVLLDHLLGARVHLVSVEDTRAYSDQLIAALDSPYVIPPGGSNGVGLLGYVTAVEEIDSQCRDAGFAFECIVHASASGGTQAGLVTGAACLPVPPDVLGFNVYHDDDTRFREAVARLVSQAMSGHGLDGGVDVLGAVRVHGGQRGAGYGLPTPACTAAIELAAQSEGLLLDPVYSGKAMAGLLAAYRARKLDAYGNVVFLHTGGSASLGVYASAFV